MNNRTTAINKVTFEQDLNRTMSNLKGSFTPEEWTIEEAAEYIANLIKK